MVGGAGAPRASADEQGAGAGGRAARADIGHAGIVAGHPTVGDARGLGLLGAIELVKDKETKEKWGKDAPFTRRLNELVSERGLLTRIWDYAHVAPPLVVTREELDRIVAILDDSLTVAEREFAVA